MPVNIAASSSPGVIVPRDFGYVEIAPQSLPEILWSARHSIFQAETRDEYGVAHENAALVAFLKGEEPQGEAISTYKPWFDQIAAAVQRGVQVSRVHLMPDIPGDYLKFEVEYSYRCWSLPSGEDVRLLRRKDDFGLAGRAFRDFYVIDDKQVITPNYSESGEFIGLLEVTNQSAIAFFVSLKKQLLDKASRLPATGAWYPQ